MVRKILLVCGILSPALYAIADALAGTRWEGYSFRDQTISELAAIGAPPRLFFAVLLLVVYGLMVAFGVGVWKSADGNHRLKVVGGLLAGLGVMALTVGQFAAMRPRGAEQGLAGAMHLVEGMAAMLMTFSAMGIAATAFGERFRIYTIVTIVLALAFGAWALSEAGRIEQGLATPWVGVKERIFWYGYQTWFVVLALRLLRRKRAAAGEDQMSNSAVSDPAERNAIMRLLYQDWRPTRLGLWVNRVQCWWSGLGLPPRFQAVLEVRGRTSGRMRSNPVVRVALSGRRHFPLSADAPLSAFASIAERYPAYRID